MDGQRERPDAMFRTEAQGFVDLIHDRLEIDLDYDEAGVAWVDGYLDRNRAIFAGSEKALAAATNRIGAYVGECIIAIYGGQWEKQDDGSWGVRLREGLVVFPANTVYKRIVEGSESSLSSLLRTLPALLARSPANT